MKKTIQLFGLLTIIFITSCNNSKNSNTNSDCTTTIKELTVKWNDFLVKQDLQSLNTIYAEQVSIYGVSTSREQAIFNKESFFKKHSDFNQSITGDITITKVTDQQYKASFPKRSTFNGKTTDVQAYLIFERVSDTWKITNESDALTDKNISKRGNSEPKIELNTCLDVVMEILTTSPVYLKKTKDLNEAIVKNGGTSFGITVEGSPNPKEDDALDYSENYDFNLHETYSERFTVIARFTFKTSDKKLYEYDVAENKFNPIEFDKKLLVKFDEICK